MEFESAQKLEYTADGEDPQGIIVIFRLRLPAGTDPALLRAFLSNMLEKGIFSGEQHEWKFGGNFVIGYSGCKYLYFWLFVYLMFIHLK